MQMQETSGNVPTSTPTEANPFKEKVQVIAGQLMSYVIFFLLGSGLHPGMVSASLEITLIKMLSHIMKLLNAVQGLYTTSTVLPFWIK